MLVTQVGLGFRADPTSDGVTTDFIQSSMMRLYEDGGTVVDGQGVRTYLYQQKEEEGLVLELSAPRYDIRPPSRACWIEWGQARGFRMAALCQWGAFEERVAELAVLGEMAPSDMEMCRCMKNQGAVYTLSLAFIASCGRDTRYIPCLMWIALGADGVLIASERGGWGWARHPVAYVLDGEMEGAIAEITSVALYILCVMNARNVVRRSHRGDARTKAKRARAGRRPQLPYYTLEIEVPDGATGRTRTVPLHRAGGGLRDDRKHGEGVVWVPAIAAGKSQKRFWTGDDDN